MIVHTEGIVLKTMDFRETSRIATFFTKEFGKVKGVMKGIRKDQRKFGSSVDKFSVNDIVYYRYSRSDLHLISQCDLKEFFFKVREDYNRNVAANYMLELVDSIMPVEEANHKIYNLMLSFLRSLEDAVEIDKLVHILQIKTLLYSGFRPHLDSCVSCRKKIKGKARFSMKSGGLVCVHCKNADTSFQLISHGTIASILHIEEKPWENALRLGLTTMTRKELRFLLNNFLVYHLERHLKSSRLLHGRP
jgi:DNA repair protein RecO (recombination protein O)